ELLSGGSGATVTASTTSTSAAGAGAVINSSSPSWPPARPQRLAHYKLQLSPSVDPNRRVLLFADNGRLLAQRAQLAAELWAVGLHAEYLHPVNLPFSHVRTFCQSLGCRWAVVFQKRQLFRGMDSVSAAASSGPSGCGSRMFEILPTL